MSFLKNANNLQTETHKTKKSEAKVGDGLSLNSR